jgi:hypothetical protein
VTVQERLLASERVHLLDSVELACALRRLLGQQLDHGVDQVSVALDLLLDGLRVGRVVVLELVEERVRHLRRVHLDGLLRDAHLLVGVGDRDVDVDVALEQVDELVAELQLCGVQLAVGGDEVVHGLDEHLLVGVVELLEELEAAQLELRVDEGVLVFVLGHGLGEELAHVPVDALEDLVEVLGELAHQLQPQRLVGLGHAARDAHLHQLADVLADEVLFGAVEVPVDIAERGQVEDDRLHLALGDFRIRAEREHPAMIH